MMLLPRSLLDYVLTSTAHRAAQSQLCRSIVTSLRQYPYSSSAKATPAVRLRFAPSPTGSLHLGGLRTALFNHLLARKLGGKWLLRIEDTDRTRFVEGAQDELLRCLEWSGLDFDEGPGRAGIVGPYVQSERRDIYDQHINTLLQQDRAYRCFCSTERLDALRMDARRNKAATHYDGLCRHLTQDDVRQRLDRSEPHVIRFRNEGLAPEQDDLVYGRILLNNLPKEDFILVKSDGMPTYHFANVVDDHTMGISHVLRGEEWILSTPKHLALYSAFGWEAPKFAHMPILVNPDGSKLSKRSGDVKVTDYMDAGWEPEALLNFVALMGASWHKSTSRSGQPLGEAMTMDEMIDNFNLDSLNKHRSTMFSGKLAYLNRNHLSAKIAAEKQIHTLASRARIVVAEAIPGAVFKDDYMVKVLQLHQDRLQNLKDLPGIAGFCFKRPYLAAPDAQKMLKKAAPGDVARSLSQLRLRLQEVSHFTASDVTTCINNLKAQEGQASSAIWTQLRFALTGCKDGPGLAALMEVLGKDETMARLRDAERCLQEMHAQAGT